MKKQICILLSVLALAAQARAEIVLSDSFNYPNGRLVGAPGSSWTAHSSDNVNPIMVTNKAIRIAGATEDVNAPLNGAPYLSSGSTVLYSAFSVKYTNLPSANGDYFAHFKDNNTGAGTGFGGRIFASTNGAVNGTYRLGIGNGSGATYASGQFARDLNTNVNYLVVTRFVPATGVATIWIDPSSESDTSVTATDTGTTARPNPIDVYAYAFRQGNSAQGVCWVSSLKVGTDFLQVASGNPIYNPPNVSIIPNQSIPGNAPSSAIPFTVNDGETLAANLVLAATSSNQGLIPNANIAFGGSATNRTFILTPLAGQEGSATITITVTDADSNVTTRKFDVTVGAPTISAIPNQIIQKNTTSQPVSFVVSDPMTPFASLIFTSDSSNPPLLPSSGIVYSGSGSNRTLTITPTPGLAGVGVITVTVSDGYNTAISRISVTVAQSAGLDVYDPFDYPNGLIVNVSGGTYVQNSTTVLSNELTVTDGKLQFNQAQKESVYRWVNYTTAPEGWYTTNSGTILYTSFEVTFSKLPTTSGGTYFFHNIDASSGTTYRDRVFVTTSGAPSGFFRFGIANGGNTPTVLPVNVTTNVTYTVVTRFNVFTAESTLWVNPSSESDFGIAATDSTTPGNIAKFAFRQTGGNFGLIALDNLRIGGAFSEVVLPQTPTPKPQFAIAKSGANVRLAWTTTNALGCVLQTAPAVVNPTWTVVTPLTATNDGGQTVITVTNNLGANAYFRLAK